MAEPTVPVQVSRIESLAERAEYAEAITVAADLRALLSQPTPTAEHDGHTVVVGPLLNDPFATPPSIADMVPGTTFIRTTDRWTVLTPGEFTGRKMVADSGGVVYYLDELDPSTIRDVTPPTGKEH